MGHKAPARAAGNKPSSAPSKPAKKK